MQTLAANLQRALAQRERDGAPGRAARRVIAAGDGWSVDDVVCTYGPRDRPFEEQHERACIAVVAAGSFDYRSTGGNALLAPGSLLLGRPGECFECGHRHAAGDRCIAFHYDPRWIDALSASAGIGDSTRRLAGARVPPSRELAPFVARACAGVLDDARVTPDLAWDELAIELAARTLTLAARPLRSRTVATGPGSAGSAGSGGSMAARSRVAATLKLIDDAPDEPHTLASLAAAAGVSEFYFLRTFSAVAGVTPHQYLLRVRLRAAALRLVHDDAKIVDIAFACGFNDVSNFNALFRAEYGASPRAWRRDARSRPTAATPVWRALAPVGGVGGRYRE